MYRAGTDSARFALCAKSDIALGELKSSPSAAAKPILGLILDGNISRIAGFGIFPFSSRSPRVFLNIALPALRLDEIAR